VCEAKENEYNHRAGSVRSSEKIRIINDINRLFRFHGNAGPMHCETIRGLLILEGRIPGINPHPLIFSGSALKIRKFIGPL
jgi:hypothetical protein